MVLLVTLVDFFGQLKLQFQLDSCPLNMLPACCGSFWLFFLRLCATVERKPIKTKSRLADCVGCGSWCEGTPGLVGLAVKCGAGTVSLGSAGLPAWPVLGGSRRQQGRIVFFLFFFCLRSVGLHSFCALLTPYSN